MHRVCRALGVSAPLRRKRLGLFATSAMLSQAQIPCRPCAVRAMRTINPDEITNKVAELVIAAARDLEPDILDALVEARDNEKSALARDVLDLLLVNADMASREKLPICQDTGVCTVFVEIGSEVVIAGDLAGAIEAGVEKGYREGFLRNSVCDPLTRKNTGTNTPPVVHYEPCPGDRLKITVLPKGCGSENMSALAMLPPSAGIAGIEKFVVDTAIASGSNPCPPVIVGVGIGGNFEKAALLAKKSLLRPVGTPAPREDLAALERRLLSAINAGGVGVEGFGGNHTCLAVHADMFPSHIASLPVAVNIQCHAHRHKETVI